MKVETDRKELKLIDLPGFLKVKESLESKGYGTEWILETVDPDEFGAVFVTNGSMYKSGCQFFAGMWLDGGISSVHCYAHDRLLPGLMYDTTCGKDYGECPFRKR